MWNGIPLQNGTACTEQSEEKNNAQHEIHIDRVIDQQFDQRETVRFFVHIHSPYHEFLPIKVVGKAVVPAAGDGSPHFRKFTRSSTAASAIAARGTATVESEL